MSLEIKELKNEAIFEADRSSQYGPCIANYAAIALENKNETRTAKTKSKAQRENETRNMPQEQNMIKSMET